MKNVEMKGKNCCDENSNSKSRYTINYDVVITGDDVVGVHQCQLRSSSLFSHCCIWTGSGQHNWQLGMG
jgi:hypothetical protein